MAVVEYWQGFELSQELEVMLASPQMFIWQWFWLFFCFASFLTVAGNAIFVMYIANEPGKLNMVLVPQPCCCNLYKSLLGIETRYS